VDENEEVKPAPKDPFWDLWGQIEIKKKVRKYEKKLKSLNR